MWVNLLFIRITIFVLAEKLDKYIAEDLNTPSTKEEMTKLLTIALNSNKKMSQNIRHSCHRF